MASHSRRLHSLVERFSRKRVLVCGDLMLDRYIRGKVSRISPEAPVPIVQVVSESHVPGGAGNVCNNLAALGASVSAVSVVGDDPAADTLLAELQARRIDTGAVLRDTERVTVQKCRIIGDHQQLLRYDHERAVTLRRQTQRRLIERLERLAPECQALIISDYGKGVVSPELLHAAIRAARRAKIPVTVDPKIEHFRRYRGVDCITPNLHEAWSGMRLLPKEDEPSIQELGWRILKSLRASSVLITRGEKGMTLFENSRVPYSMTHIPAQAKEVFDVTGAGDTVISVLSLALASGATLREAAVLANHAAGIVVAKLGTATVSAEELASALP